MNDIDGIGDDAKRMVAEAKGKQLLDLHCAHDRPVYKRCPQCEMDWLAGKSNGFTPKSRPTHE